MWRPDLPCRAPPTEARWPAATSVPRAADRCTAARRPRPRPCPGTGTPRGARSPPGSTPSGTLWPVAPRPRAHRGPQRKRRSSLASIVVVAHWSGWGDQDTWVHDPGGVQLGLRTAQRAGEQRRHLPQIPAAVVAPDRVVMGDGAAECKDRLRGRELDLIPLFEFLAGAAGGVDRVIRRRAVGIHISEAARDRAT